MDGWERADRLSERMARSVMNRYRPGDFQWHYEHGLVIQSIHRTGTVLDRGELRDWARAMMEGHILEDGSIKDYREEEYNLDQINPGKLLFDFHRETGEPKYHRALDLLRDQLKNHPRTNSGGFWHKKIYPYQMWLDGLYMQGPFFARYARDFGPREDLKDLIFQFVLIEEKARDPRTGLLYHAWDESRKQLWANPKTGCSPHFWGRAMGWYGMALADVLDILEGNRAFEEYRQTLEGIARRMIKAVLRFQDRESGLWFQILDQGDRKKNYLETSASSMFVYFLFRALKQGYLSAEEEKDVQAASLRGHEGLIRRMLFEDEKGDLHLGGICRVAGLGGSPYRDGSFDYYVGEPVVQDDFKGVGPFILASLERETAERDS